MESGKSGMVLGQNHHIIFYYICTKFIYSINWNYSFSFSIISGRRSAGNTITITKLHAQHKIDEGEIAKLRFQMEVSKQKLWLGEREFGNPFTQR